MPAMCLLADEPRVHELIEHLAASIGGDVLGPAGKAPPADWAMVGIRSRGDTLAPRLAQILQPPHGGAIDITLDRDDLSEIGPQPVVRTTEIPFRIDGMNIVLVDDVLMTGRSVRAAIQSLMDFGRPRRIWLSVLVDRGGRELPIAPDHVALDLSTPDAGLARNDHVEVHIEPTDERDEIIVQRSDQEAATT